MSAFESTIPSQTIPARMRAVTSVLCVLLALASCASVPTVQDLTGSWASAATASQTPATFCFDKDGSVEWVSQVQGRTQRVHGTFKLVGNVLTIESSDLDAPAKLQASLNFEKLDLSSPSGSVQKFTKVGGSCDQM